MAVLGSREQFCIHPKVKEEKGGRQNAMCRAMSAPDAPKKCFFKMGIKS